jgi:hypothetical protein
MDKRDLGASCKAAGISFLLLLCMIATFLGVGHITNSLWFATMVTLFVSVVGILCIVYFFPKLFEDYIDYYNAKVDIHGEKKE